MRLRRVTLVGWPGSEERTEYAEAVARLEQILTEQGIGQSGETEPAGGFIVLPGGPPRLAELLAECLDATRDQPCGLLNTGNYFTDLLQAMEDADLERLVRETQRGRLIVESDPTALLQAMAEYLPPETRWRPVPEVL